MKKKISVKKKDDSINIGVKVLKILTVECKDDFHAINILAALIASICLSHKMPKAVAMDAASQLVGIYIQRHVQKRAAKAKVKAK